MSQQFTFTATLEGSANRDGVEIDYEYDVDVTYSYSPRIPGRMYLGNGDPGYPEEPAEVEILSVTPRDKDIGGNLLADDRLTDKEIEWLTDLAFEDQKDHVDDDYDPTPIGYTPWENDW